ncbi:MAG: phospholipid scramblase-related protein [Gemmataceae bacterium]
MLEPQRFLVKERVRFLAAGQTFDLYDADADRREPIGVASEVLGPLARLSRWFVSKQLTGTTVEVREKPDDSLVFTVRRGAYLFRSRVEVHDAQGESVGWFKSKQLTWSGGFHVYDRTGRHFAEVRGNFVGFDYRVLTPDGAVELGRVTKKWTSAVKELFTSADTYLVELNDDLAEQPLAKMLVLAAALATDMIFKSGSRPAAT